MKNMYRIFGNKNSSRGGMLIELLLSIALAALIIPFVFQYQQNAVVRAQNIAIANQMTEIQVALERYILENRTELLKTVGRNITRVQISDLAPFGLPESVLNADPDAYQLRILKSSDYNDKSMLQGVIIRPSDDITPLRTREIVSLSGGTMGFIDNARAYGTYGAWRADAMDLGVDIKNAIVETTTVNRDNALYLWRVSSDNPDDAKMMSPLNLGGHDIKNTMFLNASYAEFTEGLKADKIATATAIFQNRTTIDSNFSTKNATVSGILSSDAKNMEISGTLTVADTAKMSSLTTENLWVSNLTLSGLNIEAEDDLAILKINQALDMVSGRIEAIYVTVGFTGSITPRLVVYDRIEDATNPNYFWDAESGTANLMDATFVELNRMATLATLFEGDKSTYAGQIFGAVSANKNATVSDYMNALIQIQSRVQAKYQMLKL